VDYVSGSWRTGASAQILEQRLRGDTGRAIKAVIVVHNETSTGVVSSIRDLRRVMNECGHPALLIVDAVSSLGSMEYRHDDWEVDVTVCGSQKGLMAPPGLGFNAISEKALHAAGSARMPRSYWDWQEMLKHNGAGFFTYTPATNLLFGLREALHMIDEEGLDHIVSRHARFAEATRAAVRGWGLELVPENPAEYSNSLTAVLMPQGHSADQLRKTVLEEFDMSLGTGFGKFADKLFRIGHLGWFNELMLAGTISGVEMGLRRAGVPFTSGGILAAFDSLTGTQR
jgi:alanine-glyoxylate transaminase/serine-glyoxylate transaminase/serine-pyruvate transaminase